MPGDIHYKNDNILFLFLISIILIVLVIKLGESIWFQIGNYFMSNYLTMMVEFLMMSWKYMEYHFIQFAWIHKLLS